MTLLLYAYILLLPLAAGLTGCECGGHGVDIAIHSLFDSGDCGLAEIETSTEGRIRPCGMNSHISVVQNGRRVYLQTLSNIACQWLHKTGTLSLGGSAIIS